ncbi:mannose-1-phosphate guanylyltransferase/mannose-6-phosphate isomerase [Caulobacter sp. S45]|uniref:mannose-1-phosphate guanylyltransferase/mannose-6-phosphate isomerase n=1 Tax=Caulobacter sp. S45 TaxID=1641861 RepID=UPI001575C1EB|nr:mannose-1-phosphate guanylyltransferase/mannose-6-phosphate isomerase [Caulobacter sp. S45]
MTEPEAAIQIVPVIMSGGSGTRLWPLSTDARPKQFHALAGARTMLQETALRLASTSAEGGSDPVFLPPVIICNRSHERVIETQMAEIGVHPLAVVLEPFGRNTAAVAVTAARMVQTLRPGALALLLPADHVIADPAAFHSAIARGARQPDHIVTFGIAPTGPETGYGYIQCAEALSEGVFKVARFAEKPKLEVAQAYLAEGGYYWNGGIFLFAPEVMLAEMAAHRPDIHATGLEAVDAAGRDGLFVRLDDGRFIAIPSDSVDVAVMEHTRLAAVAPCDIGWADVGSWSELWRLGGKDGEQNLIRGDAVALDTQGSLVWSDDGMEVGVVGLRDVVVVATPGAVIVLPRDRAQEVKTLVERLRARRT